MKTNSIKKILVYMLLIVCSFGLVLFNTAMSPLYDASYITHDASVFYVIGRGMKEGILPYKDLFDHKGIYIYFLYYLSSLIGENNSIGLFIVFSLLVSIFAILIYNIAKVISDRPLQNFFVALLTIIISISLYFSHGALLCEYLALITICLSMYVSIRDIYSGLSFNPRYMFLHGILFSINVFNKANYALYFLGLAIFTFINIVFIKRDVPLLLRNIIYGILGVIIGFIPGIIYCAVNGILSDMIFAVFTFNFSYVDDLNVDLPAEISTKGQAFIHCLINYANVYLFIISSLIIMFFAKRKIDDKQKFNNIILFYGITIICITFSIFMALTAYSHYLALLIPYMLPFIMVFVYGIFDLFIRKKKYIKVLSTTIFLVLSFMFAYIIGGNDLRVNFDTTASQCRRIKKTVSKYVKLDKNTKMLCFGLGSALYNYLEIIPKEKYFYMPGISYTKFKEPVTALVDNVIDFKSDVVYYATNKMVVDHFGDEVLDYLEKNYVKIMDISDYKKIYVKKEIAEKVEMFGSEEYGDI